MGSDRLCRFLRYVVEETLAGRSQAIKEYTIGVEVYGRPADYDPKIDATVRVEAGRLRSKLAKYYSGEGSAGSVRIELPRGTYVPVFSTGNIAESSLPARRVPIKTNERRKWILLTLSVIILVAATCMWWYIRTTQSSAPLSIAVLPLVNAGGNADDARFSVGLADQLTSAISQGDAFRVASRSESDRFRNSPRRLPDVAATLHVNAIIEGSVQGEAGQRRLTIQLTSARTGHQIWSQTYQSLPERSGEFQAKASELIARTLRARFAGVPESLVGSEPSQSSEAINFYQKGSEAWLTQRKSGIEESLKLYGRAIDKDAHFARAYEGIAASELFLASLDYANTAEHTKHAKTAALKAIALDDRLADPHARLGNIFLRREWNFVRAEEELQRSVVLSPGSSPITRWYSEAARLREKYADARIELEYGLLANPNSEVIETELGLLDLQLDRFADAETHMRRALANAPNYRLAHLLGGLLHERAGRFAEAENELRRWSNLTEFGQQCLAALGHVYAVEGKTPEANQVAHQLEDATHRSMSLAAVVYVGIGDHERTFSALERAYQERDKFLPVVRIDPRFRPVRSDPRFRGLMVRLGLPVAVP
jgi:TolB-like protein